MTILQLINFVLYTIGDHLEIIMEGGEPWAARLVILGY